MNTRRIWSAIIAFLLLFTGVTAFTLPSPASATSLWPVEIESTTIGGINVDSTGRVTALSCRSNAGQNTSEQAVWLDQEGNKTSAFASYQSSSQFCDKYSEANTNGYLFTWSKTAYDANSYLKGWKNGRQLWSYETSASSDCHTTSGTTLARTPQSMSWGGNGHLYFILSASNGGNGITCNDSLIGLNLLTGSVVFNESLTSGSSGGIFYGHGSQAWTYDNFILAIDRSSVLHKYEYDGDEINTGGYPYTFTEPSGKHFTQFAANADATVYGVSYSSSVETLYHKDNNTTGSITAGLHGALNQHTFDADGNLLVINWDYIDVFDPDSPTASSLSFTNPHSSTHPSVYIVDYVVDENGNALLTRSYNNSSTNNGLLEVDYLDGSRTNLLSLNGSGTGKPWVLPFSSDRAMSENSLYLPVCLDSSAGCGSSDTPADSWIYEVEADEFSTAITHTYGQNDYESDKLEYVAMGDSFSSGEGNPDFNSWTDQSSTNECHRSKQHAYPVLLANDSNLNLNLVDFVACSGATTESILTGSSGEGGWGEPAQINSLTDSTDIVTLTIGGNNVGFKGYAYSCFVANCYDGTTAYSIITGAIQSTGFHDDLFETYVAILEKASAAEVYIISYPYIVKDEENDDCLVIDSTPSGTNDQSVQTVTTLLNIAIMDAYLSVKEATEYDAISDRLHYVDSSSYFEGLDLCAEESGFIGYGLPAAYSLHPNNTGQEAFYYTMKDQLD